MDEVYGQEAPDPRTRWQRFIDRLFPSYWCETPEVNGKDVVVVRSVTNFSFLDRLRILITGCVVHESKTVTENVVGKCLTNAICYPSLRGRHEN